MIVDEMLRFVEIAIEWSPATGISKGWEREIRYKTHLSYWIVYLHRESEVSEIKSETETCSSFTISASPRDIHLTHPGYQWATIHQLGKCRSACLASIADFHWFLFAWSLIVRSRWTLSLVPYEPHWGLPYPLVLLLATSLLVFLPYPRLLPLLLLPFPPLHLPLPPWTVPLN